MVMRDCLGRTPFASLIATIICCVGMGLFCGTLYTAAEITLKGIFFELFNINVFWFESLRWAFIIAAIVMALYAIMLLIFGILATGATRQNLYSGAKCIMGGRVSAAFFLIICYIINLLWMGVTSICALPIVIWYMLRTICIVEIQDREHWYYENYCLNLSRFGIYFNFTEGVTKNALCEDHELGDFCQHVHDAGPMYIMAFIGSLMIVIGMVHYMIGMASNYQRIKLSKELTEYRDAVDYEMSESQIITPTSHKGSYPNIDMGTSYREKFGSSYGENY